MIIISSYLHAGAIQMMFPDIIALAAGRAEDRYRLLLLVCSDVAVRECTCARR